MSEVIEWFREPINRIVAGTIFTAILFVFGIDADKMRAMRAVIIKALRAVIKTYWRWPLFALEIFGMWFGLKFFTRMFFHAVEVDGFFVLQAIASSLLGILSWFGLILSVALYRESRKNIGL